MLYYGRTKDVHLDICTFGKEILFVITITVTKYISDTLHIRLRCERNRRRMMKRGRWNILSSNLRNIPCDLFRILNLSVSVSERISSVGDWVEGSVAEGGSDSFSSNFKISSELSFSTYSTGEFSASQFVFCDLSSDWEVRTEGIFRKQPVLDLGMWYFAGRYFSRIMRK